MSGNTMAGRRTALITGAGRGIGEAISRTFASQGFDLALCDIQGPAVKRLAAELNSADNAGSATPFVADVSVADDVEALFRSVEERMGAVTVLVNNAGVISVSPFVKLTESEWDRIMAVNLKSQFLCCRAAVPGMLREGWGRIINIASDAAKTAEPMIAHYSASKFGVVGLTQSIALEFADKGITANAICPAITATAMMDQLAAELSDASDDATNWHEAMVQEIPLGRPIAPNDIAATALFLASEAAGSISGQAINVSGAHEVH